jgi:16S rRNA (guanine1516-N2)-methyltransferase
VDFVAGALGYRRRCGGGRGEPIARAAGLRGGRTPSVVDATAGLGRDAFVLAALGCPLTLVERSPVVAALLEDGLRRGAAAPDVAPVVARMRLVHGDATALLPGLRADVVYLDPMYPHRDSSALVKKEMRLFQALLGPDADSERLLPAALAAARARVVVKRPAAAPPLAGERPAHEIRTKNHRFDVYLVSA